MTSESPTANDESLGPPHSHIVNAAWGWLELGNMDEASQELSRLCPSVILHPEVLLVRWELCSHQGAWDQAMEVGRHLVQVCPENPDSWIKQSYALHELKRTQEAWDALLSVSEHFEQSATIAYNLACYACQLGRCAEAKLWLQRAAERGSKPCIKKMAMADDDLKPMRKFVEAL